MIQEANLQWQYQDTECGLVMPWFTLPTLEWLKKVGVGEWNVFEYGSGYSSAWWRANASFYASVDSHLSWSKAFTTLLRTSKDHYISTCADFIVNCIIIDGEWREECVRVACNHLPKWGYLIIDNWDSENFNPSLVAKVLEGWDVKIYQQPNHRFWKTAVLQKP